MLRKLLLSASHNATLRRFAMRQGMRLGAARFVAGATLDDFVRAAKAANAAGIAVAAGYLGEGVGDAAGARRITQDFVDIVDRCAAENLRATVAFKLTHIGLDLGEDLAFENVRTIAARAAEYSNFVRMDMEESRYVDATLRIYRALRAAGVDNVGLVLQAALHRSMDDLRELLPLHPNVRLVKGAYLEPPGIATADPAEINRRFLALVELSLTEGRFTAIATHDSAIVDGTIAIAKQYGIKHDHWFEFQMLYGVREPLQRELAASGYPLRVAIPFGTDWYPYLMRRLAEKPSNVALIARSLLSRG